MTGQVQLWVDSRLADLNLAAIVASELEYISWRLWNRPVFRVVEQTVCEVPFVVATGEDGTDEGELEWEAIYGALGLSASRTHFVLTACERDICPGNSRPDLGMVGFNLHWLFKHVAPEDWRHVLGGLVRHEVGHLVIDVTARHVLPDTAELDRLYWRGDWADVRTEREFDALLSSYESPEEQRQVVLGSGVHCLQPTCIMRQRATVQARFAFAEIAGCDYCELCRRTINGPRD